LVTVALLDQKRSTARKRKGDQKNLLAPPKPIALTSFLRCRQSRGIDFQELFETEKFESLRGRVLVMVFGLLVKGGIPHRITLAITFDRIKVWIIDSVFLAYKVGLDFATIEPEIFFLWGNSNFRTCFYSK
jgi:hypothetical protein